MPIYLNDMTDHSHSAPPCPGVIASSLTTALLIDCANYSTVDSTVTLTPFGRSYRNSLKWIVELSQVCMTTFFAFLKHFYLQFNSNNNVP